MNILKPIRLIATDLDGTLLNENFEITPAVMKSIELAQQNGIQVIIITGRDRSSTISFLETLHLTDNFIGSGGAEVWYQGQVVRRCCFTAEQTQVILDKVVELDCGAFIDQLPHTWNFGSRKYIEMHSHLSVSEEVKDRNVFFDPTPNKIAITQEPEVLQGIREFLAAEYPEFTLASPFTRVLDINPANANKGAALRFFATSLLKLPIEQIAVIGDSENDLSLFQSCGISFAVGNAVETLKQRAMFIAPPNSEDGFCWMVNQVIQTNKNIGTNPIFQPW